jgi:tRNA-specific adenosine deaminase 1
MSDRAAYYGLCQSVFDLLRSLPQNGKPSPGQFTVLAAVVASIHQEESDPINIVLSLATGTKCIGNEFDNKCGFVIHDSHAEVLARRGFVHFLLLCVLAFYSDPSVVRNIEFPLEAVEPSSADCPLHTQHTTLRMKSSWKLHLFISDPPCGDASLYPTAEGISTITGAKLASSSNSAVPSHRSTDCGKGAKAVDASTALNGFNSEPAHGGAASSTHQENKNQDLGAIRTKSGRSDLQDLHRTLSLSCSDKICRWINIGMQG